MVALFRRKKSLKERLKSKAKARFQEEREFRAQKKKALREARMEARAVRKEAFIEARKKRILARAKQRGMRAGAVTRSERAEMTVEKVGKAAKTFKRGLVPPKRKVRVVVRRKRKKKRKPAKRRRRRMVRVAPRPVRRGPDQFSTDIRGR